MHPEPRPAKEPVSGATLIWNRTILKAFRA